MENKKKSFTSKESEVYKLVLKDPYSFTASTAMEIANRYHVSQSAISRFCKKIGFDGFSDFRLSMMLEQSNPISNPNIDHDFIWHLSDYLSQLNIHFTNESSEKIIDRILKSKCIYMSGYGASSFAASWLSFRLTLSGIYSVDIPSSQEMEYLHVMDSKDTLMIFSNSNPSHKDFFSLLNDLDNSKKPYIILISGIKKHPFAKYANQVIVLPNQNNMQYNYKVDSTITQLDFGIILMNRLLDQISKSNI
ncbi:MAG: MurR/RpiR family transcriptional regulator [Solobacterium sp.]|nr:MurR/RpiR family transcriptional regulator [Solobacterium sp.]